MFFWEFLKQVPKNFSRILHFIFFCLDYYRSYRYSFLWSERPPAPGLADAVTYLEESGVVTE